MAVKFPCLYIEGAMRCEDANEKTPSRGSYRMTVLSTYGSILRVFSAWRCDWAFVVRNAVRVARGRDDLWASCAFWQAI